MAKKDKISSDLLGSSSSDEESSTSSSSDDDDDDNQVNPMTKHKSILKINQKYAKQFQERKLREELINVRQEQKLRDLKAKVDGMDDDDSVGSESSSSDEDEDAELLTPGVDLQILKVIKTKYQYVLFL